MTVDNHVMLLQADVFLSRNMLMFLIQYYYGKLMFPARCESTCGRVSGLIELALPRDYGFRSLISNIGGCLLVDTAEMRRIPVLMTSSPSPHFYQLTMS